MHVRAALAPKLRPALNLGEAASIPFVGRAAELRNLLDSLDDVRANHRPRLVTLVGEPGIGKSRLVAELHRLIGAASEPVAWRAARSLPYSENMPFWALAEIIRAECGIRVSDTSGQIRNRLRLATQQALPSDPGAAAWVAEHLQTLVGGDSERATDAGNFGAARQSDAMAAWRRFLLTTAAHHPMVLVLEDMHWADDAFLDFLTDLVEPAATERASAAALLIVATARPQLLERRPGWRELITLAPLADAEMAQLLDALLTRYQLSGDEALSGGRSTDLLARVGGNPLFAEEYVRMLRDQDVLQTVREALPTSVHAIIAARIDALQPDEKAILHDAAILGRSGSFEALLAVSDHQREALDAGLDGLARKELLHRLGATAAGAEGDIDFEFGHILIRDVAYDQMPRLERSGKHQHAARWLQTLQAPDNVERIAYHYEQALRLTRDSGKTDPELMTRTAHALRDAGDRAAMLGVHTTAARYYTKALDVWPAASAEYPDLEFRAGRSLCHAENRGDDLLVQARDTFLSMGQRERAAEAEVLLAQISNARGDGQRSEHLLRARSIVEESPPSPSKAVVLQGCVMDLVMADRYDEAIRIGQSALHMAHSLRLHDIEAEALGAVGHARVCRGDDAGVADLERCVELLHELRSAYVVRWQSNLADALAILGDLPRSFAVRARAIANGELFGLGRSLRWIQLELTEQHHWSGNWDEAVHLVDRLADESAGGQGHYLASSCHVCRGRIRLARDELDGALDDAARALELARASGGDAQNLEPALAFAARSNLVIGQRDKAQAPTEELLAGLAARRLNPQLGIDLPVVLTALGYPSSALDGVLPSPWLDAARAYLDGDPLRAAGVYARIGSQPDEVEARLEAARGLLARGETVAAGGELERVQDFYRSVGAHARVRAAEALRDRAGGDGVRAAGLS